MTTKQNKIIGARIREARLAKGYSMSDLSRLVGDISKQAISQYESGDITPTAEKFEKIVNVLGFPHDYFYSQTPVVLNEPIFFRKYKTAQNKECDMAKCRVKWMVEILDYLQDFFDFVNVNVIEKVEPKPYSDEEIENIAVEVRKLWGMGLGPISDLHLLLENNGFIISKSNLGERKMDACSTRYGDRPLQFLTSDKSSACRSRFDAAHELGHRILHQAWVDFDYLNNKDNYERIEYEANRFAGALLMPRESFMREVYSDSFDSLINLKRRWKVSIAMIMYRGRNLGVFNENQYEYLQRQRSWKGFKTREPLDDEIPDEEPRTLNKAMNILIKQKIQSVEQILDSIKLPVHEIEALCNLDMGSLNTNNKVPTLRLIKSI